jgi:hypothetical protein
MSEQSTPEVNLETVKMGDPVEVFAVGASISHGEKRFVAQYNGNDYFTSYQLKFNRPVQLKDTKGMSSINRQLALAMSLATQVNRKCQVRDGITSQIGPEVANELQLTPEGKILEGAVLPGKEVDSIRAQLASLRASTDASLTEAAEAPTAPGVEAEEAIKPKTTRKRKKPAAESAEVIQDESDLSGTNAPLEEVL